MQGASYNFYVDPGLALCSPRRLHHRNFDRLGEAMRLLALVVALLSMLLLPSSTRCHLSFGRVLDAVAWRRGAGEQTFLARTLLAASVRWLEADDAARLRPAYMSVEDVWIRIADNLSVIDPFPLLHLPNPNVPVAVADFGLRGFAITRFLAVLLDASIAAGSVRVPWHLPLGVKVLMERVVMFCLVMFGLVLRSRSRG